ncbi:MAG TPA: ATP-binding protein [Cytophagaceae bacterium]|jgi:hypothetical protein|nr:ATP-binding protein [Cytophagaceae bacterium]
MKIFTKKWFRSRLNSAIKSAGRRYTPQANVTLPINRLFNWLARTEEFYKELFNLGESFQKEWEESSLKKNYAELNIPSRIMNKLENEMAILIKFVATCQQPTFNAIDFNYPLKIIKKADKKIVWLHKFLREKERKLIEGADKEKQAYPTPKDKVNNFLKDVIDIREILNELRSTCGSNYAKITNDRSVLLLGEAGIGKTHLLCDFTEKQIKNNIPAIIVLGQQLQTIDDPLQSIVTELRLTLSSKAFLRRLNAIAKVRNQRILIVVDAINEGDRKGWRQGFQKFLSTLKKYPGIAIALSCRTPFDKVTVPVRSKIVKTYHRGFASHELDALKIYTAIYKLPLPEIPILSPEFSNPLFLKLFCESLEGATIKKKHAQIHAISSGQKGMTNILEDIVIKKGEKIAKSFGFVPKFVWQLIKDDFASSIADKGNGWILLSEAQQILNKHIKNSVKANKFLKALISESLLAEDIVYEHSSKTPKEVVRFTYQKFSDHIIARHLLIKKFDKNDPKSSFTLLDKLGWLFKDEHAIYNNAGLIEAIMIEFPNRINNKGEMFDFLPVKVNGQLAEMFINGLYWRDSKSFNEFTSGWVSGILKQGNYRNQILDILVALATKPKHPFNAARLDNYLKKFKMSDRDLHWSEYLRYQDETSAALKIVDWIERFSGDISEEYALNYVSILKWFLTSTRRMLRDRSTRALYYLGKWYPSLLFNETLSSLEINDRYVSERMFASAYGVVMALHFEGKNDFNKKILEPFARKIFLGIFSKTAKYGTTHILMRDYARYIIEIALLHNNSFLKDADKVLLQPPYKNGGIRSWGEVKESEEDKKNHKSGSAPMHMDFENYTVGRLVDHRNNYDYKNQEYQKVLANIFWRIYKLGYSHEIFKDIDSQISEYNWNSKEQVKTDRYGKKYCWIAFYEVAGHRQDNGKLPERYGQRIPDTDIDPSFPNPPKSEEIVKVNFLNNSDLPIADWIKTGPIPDMKPYLKLNKLSSHKGSWIMIDGYVSQDNLINNRSMFAFVRGFFIDRSQSSKLIEAFKGLEPSADNRLIDDIESDYYTFAGEVPWCETYPYQRYKKEIEIPTGNKKIIHEKIDTSKPSLVIKFRNKEIRMPNYSEEVLKKGFIEREEDERLIFNIELPVRTFGWESERSITNPGHGVRIPTKEICEALQLSSRAQTFDMFDPSSRVASITRGFGDMYHNGQKITYLRKNLLDRYLKMKKLDLMWIISGERRFLSKDHQDLQNFAKKHTSYFAYKYILPYIAC